MCWLRFFLPINVGWTFSSAKTVPKIDLNALGAARDCHSLTSKSKCGKMVSTTINKHVCLLCTDEGVSPRDAERYICSQCNKKWGHKIFVQNCEVNNSKRPDRKSRHCCEKCKPRLADLKSKVSTSTRRCFCWHAPGIHADTCLVFLVEGNKKVVRLRCRREPQRFQAFTPESTAMVENGMWDEELMPSSLLRRRVTWNSWETNDGCLPKSEHAVRL